MYPTSAPKPAAGQRIANPQLEQWVNTSSRLEQTFVGAGHYYFPSAPLAQPAISEYSYPATDYPSNEYLGSETDSTSTDSSTSAPAMRRTSVAYRTPSTAPSLSWSTTTGSNDTSVATSAANGVVARQRLLEDRYGDDNLYAEPEPLECTFRNILPCNDEFNDEEQWKTHCESHFRGARPPGYIACPYCGIGYTSSDKVSAWDARMDHIADFHRGEHALRSTRPDPQFITYLWQQSVIDVTTYQHFIGGARGPQYFVETNNASRQRREPRGWNANRTPR